jgi:threonyl-tRNA synthetase
MTKCSQLLDKFFMQKHHLTPDDKLYQIRHSLNHVLASAILERFPEAKLGVGPVIENGFFYDFLLPERLKTEDLAGIEKRMREIIQQNLSFHRTSVSLEKAREIFQQKQQPFKLELIDDIEKYGTTKVDAQKPSSETSNNAPVAEVSLYETGAFLDLCAGGHVATTNEIPIDAFKLDRISGAYWRGSEKNASMTRIYGLAFETKKALEDYVQKMEESAKRDHRVLNERLGIFLVDEQIGRGLPIWMPNGYFIRRKLEDFMYAIEQKNGYVHVLTPHLAKEDLYLTSGHLAHYQEDMYAPLVIDEEKYYLKPMNCPHHHSVYKHHKRSYRELPLRIAEFGCVYRYERSGVLSGFIRTRGFTQNDSHIYGTEKTLETEVTNVLALHKHIYDTFDIRDYYYRLSLPDFDNAEKFGNVKNPEVWEKGSQTLRNVLSNLHYPFEEAIGEASFYGPKVDIQVTDIYGKEETIATVQIDYYSADKFHLSYVDEDGMEKPVVIVHRAILGSFERFTAFLIEKTGGNLPVWLVPTQVQLLPVSEKVISYASEIESNMREANIRVFLDNTPETLNKRIREAELSKIPYLAIVGEKEQTEKTISLRNTYTKEQSTLPFSIFLERLKRENIVPLR